MQINSHPSEETRSLVKARQLRARRSICSREKDPRSPQLRLSEWGGNPASPEPLCVGAGARDANLRASANFMEAPPPLSSPPPRPQLPPPQKLAGTSQTRRGSLGKGIAGTYSCSPPIPAATSGTAAKSTGRRVGR